MSGFALHYNPPHGRRPAVPQRSPPSAANDAATLCHDRRQSAKVSARVSPFAAVEDDSAEALADLYSLMEPGEATYLMRKTPPVFDGWKCEGPVGVLQMTYPEDRALPVSSAAEDMQVEELTCAHAEEMVELTSVAFPGFFRRRTCEMGQYYGIRFEGRLMAMCGERMAIGEFRELSGLCTHPEVRGRGYASLLLTRLMQDHRATGLRSYLHVSTHNRSATEIYRRMGFDLRGEFPLYLLTRGTS